jgi:enoyl-CoA hydratase/carnithine racemase
MLVRLSRGPVMSIVSIRGRATGVGSELALASDMRFASREKAILSQWEVGAGPGGGPMARLPCLMGRGRALEVLLGADDIHGDLAERSVTLTLPSGLRARRVRRCARHAHRLVRQAGDRSGRLHRPRLLHALYQQCLKHNTEFCVESFAFDLLMDDDGTCRVARCTASARIARYWRPAAMAGFIALALPRTPAPVTAMRCAARGPAARRHGVHAVSSERHLWLGLPDRRRCARRGRLFHQFGRLALHGALCAECQGSRRRDVVCRAMTIEINEGRGCGWQKDYIELYLEPRR